MKFENQYNANGNIGFHKDFENGMDFGYRYDLANRLSEVEDSKGNLARLAYDAENNVNQVNEVIQDQTHQSLYEYDSDNRLINSSYNYVPLRSSEVFPFNGGSAGSTGTHPISESVEYKEVAYGILS